MDSWILIFIAILPLVLTVVGLWYFRFRQNKQVAERVRRAPQSYIGRLATGVYQIPRTGNSDNRFFIGYATPPPTFRKALNYPLPTPQLVVLEVFEEPPPTYQQYLALSAIHSSSVEKYKSPASCSTFGRAPSAPLSELFQNAEYNNTLQLHHSPDPQY